MSAPPINEPADEQAAGGAPARLWPDHVWLALPRELEQATGHPLYDHLRGRLDEQRAHMVTLGRGLDDLHQRELRSADRIDALETALRGALERERFLVEACKTLEARIADLEAGRRVP